MANQRSQGRSQRRDTGDWSSNKGGGGNGEKGKERDKRIVLV